MTAAQARERFASARVVCLASADLSARPHLVPIAFALDGDCIYSVVDAKPKRSVDLRRLANVRENPAVAVLADHYDDGDWDALWWVRADGRGRVLDPAEPEAERAIALLGERYPRQRARGEVLAIDVARWSGWEGSGS